MTDAPKITALSPWFGGKRNLASDIVVQLGPHVQYFEPFCGSMAVLFAKPPSRKETVNDLHGDLINLARVVKNSVSAEILYDRAQRSLMCEGLLKDAQSYLADPVYALREEMSLPEMTDRGYWYFIASWMARSGCAGTEEKVYQIAVRWTKSGGSASMRFNNAVASIPWWHQRLRNVVILHRDAFRILDRFEDCEGTAIYVDPPYMANSRTGFESKKTTSASRYLHEFSHGGSLIGTDDHDRLAAILRIYKHARIVVSYYDCPRVRELYDGWLFIEKTRTKTLTSQNRDAVRADVAPELLIINGPARKG